MSATAARQARGSGTAGPASSSPAKRAKLAAFLITGDADLWPEISPHLPAKLQFRQIDSIDELLGEVPPDTPAVVIWDARGAADKSEELSRIQSHSACFAMLVLDDDDAAWTAAVQHGQIVGLLPVPIDQSRLIGALGGAYEEVNARVALLGGRSGAPASTGGGRRLPRKTIAGVAVVLIAAMAVLILRRPAADLQAPRSVTAGAPQPARSAAAPDAPGADAPAPDSLARGASAPDALPAAYEEKVDALIDQAQHAMRDRHFIDPLEGSALSLYRSALVLDPSSGEARQGLQRLAEVLLARVQSALDERQFDAALQALETARSIDPSDQRLAALDERIAKMRTELGPAEILAAINAQNFDRAAQLIEQAARTKSIGEAKLNQLREDLRRHRADSADSRLLALTEARLQQDQLVDPPNDSAVYYLTLARKAGATSADLQAQFRELSRRLMLAARADIAQQRLDDADRLAADLRSIGVPLSQVAGLQRDIGLARAQHAAVPAPETPPRAAPEASQPVQAESSPEPAPPPASPPAGGPREVVEASLTRTRPLQIDYPMYALSKKIEGQVEVAYLVTPKGVVSDLKVLTATPPGLFDDAATTAISRLRYKPVIDAGKPVAVSTKMLVTFRLAK